jgi:3-oxo-5-alpha-steroid 4-dehydrogenase 1
MEIVSPAIFVFGLLVPPADNLSTTELLLATAWIGHYINRVFLYTYRAPSIAPMHATTVAFGVAFNSVNAYLNSRWVALYGRYPECGYRSPRFMIGMFVFAIGMWINYYHDNLLFSLRRSRTEDSDSKGEHLQRRYLVPRGGLFEYVSCPHYFGETIEWIGFAIAAWYSMPAILFALATPANLFPRAWNTHIWYKGKFREEYPLNRKAVVPFLL